ncbi:TetR/AcrR family transcriptional regulator [Amycolatopsis sp. DSM 110486]|uniref:TetR/AcrR family transcriptional regulator n=1 Tax=Amycolatopsis sp. DSM 110486 TaxID=2865832 RepID=UPI001C699D00|nr:TetR/AcrR family transcriptional regulator [Amycolatopsis sp. DSM 110486]QYN17376.1 TetR/AcrR family transcriptional regulator [Amycolatopsis sp. DSM 110486]
MPDEPNRDRADRILDAAAELLVRWGSRKVTIEDIARRAGIGKGTVYLHWRTKDSLFGALLMRASVRLLEASVAELRADPHTVVPHRYFRSTFLLTTRDPLLSAMLANDTELLGDYAISAAETQREAAEAVERTFELFLGSGLLRGDIPDVRFALGAASSGFYLYGNINPEFADTPLEARADALARVIRAAFEPPGEPDPGMVEKAADELRTVFEAYASAARAVIYPGKPTTGAG